MRLWLILVCFLAGFAPAASATDYYVSAAGADTKSGTSPTAAWRTLSRVNSVSLRPGDRVLLRGGDTFAGTLTLDASDRGTPSAPVTLSSYGTGRATIAAGNGRGIWIYNSAGIAIANLNVTGSGGAVSGVTFYSDLAGDVKLPFVRVDSVDVSGFGRDGIEIGSWNGRTGYSDVRVTNASLHGNGRSGLFTYAQLANVHQQVYVGHVRAFDNPGIPGSPTNSGSGIVLASVDGGTIERSVAYGNGRLCASTGGPIGIWTYDSTNVLIQFNESFANRTAANWDGGGFDLDQNVSNSIVQFNYSHDNDGAGYLLAHSPLTDAHYGNVVRYNISQNDARANSYGAIEIWGRVTGAEVYNNTVFVDCGGLGLAEGRQDLECRRDRPLRVQRAPAQQHSADVGRSGGRGHIVSPRRRRRSAVREQQLLRRCARLDLGRRPVLQPRGMARDRTGNSGGGGGRVVGGSTARRRRSRLYSCRCRRTDDPRCVSALEWIADD